MQALSNLASKKFGVAVLTQFCLWSLGTTYPGWSMAALIIFGVFFVFLQWLYDIKKLKG